MGNFYSGNIRVGSSGDDVKAWQNYLIGQGYDIKADGIFGTETRLATGRWQSKNGIRADGNVGDDSWGKAGFKNLNNPTSAPTIDPAPTTPTFNSTNFNDTTDGTTKKGAMEAALENYNKYGENWKYKDQYSTLFEDYIGRDKFSYDLNGDALYQQYKDKYIQQGKLAMQDTMGQASAMTGGYGSSYAQSVGQQAYQNSLDNLNDIVPELYQMAYDRYNQEGTDMLNKLGVMDTDYERGYNEAKDRLSIAISDYYSAADLYNTDRDTANDLAQADYTNRFNAWDVARQEAWNQANFDEGIRQFENSHDLQKRQLALQEKTASANKTAKEEEKATDDPFKAVNTKAMQNFKSAIKTKAEFYLRGGEDKKTYGSYEAYIEGILDKWLSEGRFSDPENEVASLLVYYGLD